MAKRNGLKMIAFLAIVVVGVALFAWLGVVGYQRFSDQASWAEANHPEGKFATAAEYLAWGRLPSRIDRVELGSGTYYVAYGPMDDHGEHVPSGPPAYVFGPGGRLVAWSHDIGNDTQSIAQWLQPSARGISLTEFTEAARQNQPAR